MTNSDGLVDPRLGVVSENKSARSFGDVGRGYEHESTSVPTSLEVEIPRFVEDMVKDLGLPYLLETYRAFQGTWARSGQIDGKKLGEALSVVVPPGTEEVTLRAIGEYLGRQNVLRRYPVDTRNLPPRDGQRLS